MATEEEFFVAVKQIENVMRWHAMRMLFKAPRMVELEDLMQEGRIEAYRASLRYDPSKGASLATFIQTRWHGAMVEHIRKHRWSRRNRSEVISDHEQELEGGADTLTDGVSGAPDLTLEAKEALEGLEKLLQRRLSNGVSHLEIFSLFMAGYGQNEIGQMTGVSSTRIHQIIEDWKTAWTR